MPAPIPAFTVIVTTLLATGVVAAHVALLTTCTYTLLLVAVKTDVVNVVAVVLAAPWDTPGGVPGDEALVTNHSYVGAGVEPVPPTVAVN